MHTIGNKLFFVYILAMPFTSAFALSGTINLPIITAMFLLGFNVVYNAKNKALPINFITKEIVLISLFLFFVLVSFLVNGLAYSFSLNHTLAYFSSFLLFFISPFLFFISHTSPQQLLKSTLKVFFIAVLISSLFSLFEFTLTNFFSINVTDFIPRANVKEYDPLITGFLIRSRGFAEESGHYGFMMELFAPLSIYYLYFSNFCTLKPMLKNIATFCIIISIITSFSVSSFILIPFSILLAIVLKFNLIRKELFKNYKKILLTIFVVLIVWQIINAFIPLNEILQITLDEKLDSFSLNDRQERSDYFWQKFPKLPLENILFGSGPSWYKIFEHDESYTFLSVYQTIAFENGLISLLLVFAVLFFIFIKLIKIQHVISIFLLTSFIAGLLHYNNISNYWYPWFWFLISFIMFYYYSFSLKNENEN